MKATRPSGIGELVLAEGDDGALGAGIDALQARPALARPLISTTSSRCFTSSGSSPKRSTSSAPKRSISARLLELRQAPVEAEPELQVAHVGLRDQHGGAEPDLRAPLVLRLGRVAALQGGHRLLEHGLVELEADLADVARLLLAQEVAGAADVEVVARRARTPRPGCRATAAP